METGEQAFCRGEQHGLATVICASAGERAVNTNVRIGTHTFMHASSAGKGIPTHLLDERVAEILDQWELRRFTENTIPDRKALFRCLEKGREPVTSSPRRSTATVSPPSGHVVVEEGESLTAEEVTEFVGARLTDFKKPRKVQFSDELPRNPPGRSSRNSWSEDPGGAGGARPATVRRPPGWRSY